MTDAAEDVQAWIGRDERVEGELDASHARAAAAMLDRPWSELTRDAPLPPLWHWFFFPALARPAELGGDGHSRRGGFLPPVTLPRRMWAGGRVRWDDDLRIGRPAERRSRIGSIEEKTGRSGRLVLVTVEHRILQSGAVVVSEEQDLIFREAPVPAASRAGGSPELAPPAEWEQRFTTDPVLLFRFSALTFNGHRIHYDWRYATEVEGYPDVVVHGPLTALALLESARARAGRVPAAFSYRGLLPVFCGEEAVVGGRTISAIEDDVWAAKTGGALVMRATVAWKE